MVSGEVNGLKNGEPVMAEDDLILAIYYLSILTESKLSDESQRCVEQTVSNLWSTTNQRRVISFIWFH